MIRLTPHFTLQELTFSQTATRKGIDNTPEPKILDNLFILANGMEDVRNLLNAPVHISSGYRCIELNDLLGSKRTSQHTQGLACDFTSNAYGTPSDVVLAIVSSNIPYDQVILEFDKWVHISFPADKEKPRQQAFVINKSGVKSFT